MDGLERVLNEDPLLRSGASRMGTAHLNNGAGIHGQDLTLTGDFGQSWLGTAHLGASK